MTHFATYDYPAKLVSIIDKYGNILDFDTNFAERIISAGAGTSAEYVGIAKAGTSTADAGWQIRYSFYDFSTGEEYVMWADGNADFDNVWDNRAGISYW